MPANYVFDEAILKGKGNLNTRGNNSKVIIPKTTTEACRKSFTMQGALVFKLLPNSIRDENSYCFSSTS